MHTSHDDSMGLVICTLVGRGHFDLFKVALQSWLSGLSPSSVYVHDDGSLTEDDAAWTSSHGCIFIPYAEATPQVCGQLGMLRCDRLLRLRQSAFRLSMKLSDIILLHRQSEVVLFLDADIFLLQSCDIPTLPPEVEICGMKDVDSAYRIGLLPDSVPELPQCFNSGMLYFRPALVDPAIFESYLRQLDRAWVHYGDTWLLEQTCWAVYAAQRSSRLFCPDLVAIPESDLHVGAAIWHLAGALRKQEIKPARFDQSKPPVKIPLVHITNSVLDAFLPRSRFRIAANFFLHRLKRAFGKGRQSRRASPGASVRKV